MRHHANFLGCVLLADVLGGSVAYTAPTSVDVRVYGSYVNFRRQVPQTFPQTELVQRPFLRFETLTVYYQKLGPSPDGPLVPWYFVSNRATGEDGWVISTFVQP